MKPYPKHVLPMSDLLQKYIDAGMIIKDLDSAETKLNEIGYYRLRGYSFQMYDTATKKYKNGTTFDNILNIYYFDSELRQLLFDMTCQIEVALRARFCGVMLQQGDPMIYFDASLFYDKERFWKNISTLTAEISRSDEAFIEHNYKNHAGQIPIWAAIEIMSFGNLSKYINNLIRGTETPVHKLAQFYPIKKAKDKIVCPNQGMFTSWIHCVVVLRNICAHNYRIYNRSFKIKPPLLKSDYQSTPPRFWGVYYFLLAMKYLRPSDASWNEFTEKFKYLLQKYHNDIDFMALALPTDWENHICLQEY